MTAELKRALLQIIADWWLEPFPETTEEQDQAELLRRILARLAAGSPEVIEAMARALDENAFDLDGALQQRKARQKLARANARAALAAGMKVIAS